MTGACMYNKKRNEELTHLSTSGDWGTVLGGSAGAGVRVSAGTCAGAEEGDACPRGEAGGLSLSCGDGELGSHIICH